MEMNGEVQIITVRIWEGLSEQRRMDREAIETVIRWRIARPTAVEEHQS